MPYDADTPIAFRFHFEDQSPDVTWAARIVTDGDQILTSINPGTPFQRRGNKDTTRTVTSFFPNGNGSLAVELASGEVFRTHERGAERRALKRVRQLGLGKRDQNDQNASNTTESPQWYVLYEFLSAIAIGVLTKTLLQAHNCGRCRSDTEHIRPSTSTRSC